ncbi:MAG: peptidoglycan editing factor PgeF [Ignavibacteriae bacterium]|nr:peptidoglycan editing factor PgeF [Ignavibacteriota bacterium]
MLIIRSNILSEQNNLVFGLSSKIGHSKNENFHFNMSKSIGDDEDKVNENRKLFFNKLNLSEDKVVIQKQTHGDTINIIDSPSQNLEGDAIITSTPNIGLAISTADCNNIFIYDKSKKVIAAVHSGWKGTEIKILKKTLNKLKDNYNSDPKDLIVYAGPAISKENYEVGEEVAAKFDKKYVEKKNNSSKYFLDLKNANLDMVLDFGVPESNIQFSQMCSFETEKLQSYRREGENSGRALGVIALQSVSKN